MNEEEVQTFKAVIQVRQFVLCECELLARAGLDVRMSEMAGMLYASATESSRLAAGVQRRQSMEATASDLPTSVH